MNEKIVTLTIMFLLILGTFSVVGIHTVKNKTIGKINTQPEYVAGEVIVVFQDFVDLKSMDRFAGYPIRNKIETLNAALLKIEGGEDAVEVVLLLQKDHRVKYADLNYVSSICYIPNDPEWDQQWGPKNIKCPEAWDVEKGSKNVVVAIIDSGIDYTHPDLADNIWINEDEIPDNGIDDDGNDKIDDVMGWDFAIVIMIQKTCMVMVLFVQVLLVL